MMRKRIITVSLVLALALSMYGCFTESRTDGTVTDTEISETENDTKSETVMTDKPIELYTVEIKQETAETDAYTANMIYPQVSGYSDTEIEEKVNALIRSYAVKKMNDAVSHTGAASGVNYDVDSFDVTYKGDKLISALCRGSVSVDGDAYETGFAYGINIDFKGAKLIGFDGIVDYSGFKNDFEAGSFKQVRGYEKLLEETNYADMIAQYDPLYSIYPEFYIKQTGYGINLGVITDTIHVLGDVAEFEVSADGKKYIKEYFTELTESAGVNS